MVIFQVKENKPERSQVPEFRKAEQNDFSVNQRIHLDQGPCYAIEILGNNRHKKLQCLSQYEI